MRSSIISVYHHCIISDSGVKLVSPKCGNVVHLERFSLLSADNKSHTVWFFAPKYESSARFFLDIESTTSLTYPIQMICTCSRNNVFLIPTCPRILSPQLVHASHFLASFLFQDIKLYYRMKKTSLQAGVCIR